MCLIYVIWYMYYFLVSLWSMSCMWAWQRYIAVPQLHLLIHELSILRPHSALRMRKAISGNWWINSLLCSPPQTTHLFPSQVASFPAAHSIVQCTGTTVYSCCCTKKNRNLISLKREHCEHYEYIANYWADYCMDRYNSWGIALSREGFWMVHSVWRSVAAEAHSWVKSNLKLDMKVWGYCQLLGAPERIIEEIFSWSILQRPTHGSKAT